MAEEKQELFRKEALERMSSPERLDQLIRIVAPKDWLFLGSALLIVSMILAWCVWGRLPTTVNGQGVILRPRRIVEIQSQASGRLVTFRLRVGDAVRRGDIIGVIDQAEIRKQLQEDRARLKEFQSQDREKTSLHQEQFQLQSRDVEAQKKYLTMQSLNKEKLIKDAEVLAPILKKRMESRKAMMDQGLIPKVSDEALQAEKEFLENQSRISELQAQLREIESQLKQLDTKQQELQRQLFEASTGRKNEILTLTKNIALYEVQLERDSKITSEYSGRVLEIAVNAGQVLSSGSRIASVEFSPTSEEMVCVTYFPVRDGKRVRPGMKIQVTPDTVKRERFGGILGRVTSVSAFPVTKEAATIFLGTPEVVSRLVKDEPQIEVVANLRKDASNASGFKWSSSAGPPISISAGTTTTARVTVEERAPVSYILPFLRSVSGIY